MSLLDQLMQLESALENHNVSPPYSIKLTRKQFDQLCAEAAEHLLYETSSGQASFFSMKIEVIDDLSNCHDGWNMG